MRYQITIIFIFLVQWNLIKASQEQEEKYKFNIEQHFKRQCFDSCLFFQYLLTNSHFKKHDSISLVKDWYFTAWINILQEKYAQAGAAKILAGNYAVTETNFLENVYMGLLYYKQEAYKKALPYLKDIAKNHNPEYTYITYLVKIFLLNTQAELTSHEKGISEAKKLLAMFKANNDTSWFGYALAKKILGIHLYRKDKFLASLKALEDAVSIYEWLNIYNSDWIECYKFLMDASWYANRLDLRDDYFWRLNSLFSKFNSEILPYYYYLKGNLFYTKNQLKEAINVYLKVFSGIKTLPKDNYYAFRNMLQSYFYLGQYNKIIEWYERLKPELKEYLKILLAYSYYETGNKERAFKLIEQVEKSYECHDINSWYFLGDYYFKMRSNNKVEYYFKKYIEQVLKTYGKVGYTASFAYSALGYFYWYGKFDYKKSLYYYHQAVNSLVMDKHYNDFYALPDVTKSINDEELSRALNNKGEAFYEVSKERKTKAEALRDLQACLANLELSLEIAHRFKMTMTNDEKKYNYTENIQHRYYYIVKVCLELYQKTGNQTYVNKAFEYTEKSKATMLLSTIRGFDAYKLHLIPDSLKKNEDRLLKQTELVSLNLSKQYDSPKPDLNVIDKLNNELYALKRQQVNLIQLFKRKYPVYYKAKFDDNVIEADKLQKLLNPDEVILQYSLSPDRIVIFCLTSKELRVFNDTITKKIYSDLQYYRKFVAEFSDYNCLDTAVKSFEKRSNDLYNVLIKPTEPYIINKHLIIIPDGLLTQIPFEALITERKHCKTFKRMSFLIRKNTISYEYSGTLFSLNQQYKHVNNAKLLVMAPTYDITKLSKLPDSWKQFKNDSTQLLDIPGTYEEVKNICKSFNGTAIIKKKATEKKFKEIAGNYNILHLAMHGELNDKNPMLSKLIFTPVIDSVNEGLLNTYEIYGLPINAQLVVLSACNTGSGKLYKGEGVISLARAFYTAGTKSVIMTLWSVSDKTSSSLISNFYSNLASQKCIGDALHKAKLDYIDQVDGISAHPYFWAGYIVTGNSSIVFEAPKSHKYLTWLLLSTGLVLVSIIIILNKKKLFKLF